MGSTSDWGVMKAATDTLAQFGVEFETKVLSAHRTPAELEKWVSGLRQRGFAAVIAAAGGAAHLAGVVAAFTTPSRNRSAYQGKDSRRARLAPVDGADAFGNSGGCGLQSTALKTPRSSPWRCWRLPTMN